METSEKKVKVLSQVIKYKKNNIEQPLNGLTFNVTDYDGAINSIIPKTITNNRLTSNTINNIIDRNLKQNINNCIKTNNEIINILDDYKNRYDNTYAYAYSYTYAYLDVNLEYDPNLLIRYNAYSYEFQNLSYIVDGHYKLDPSIINFNDYYTNLNNEIYNYESSLINNSVENTVINNTSYQLFSEPFEANINILTYSKLLKTNLNIRELLDKFYSKIFEVEYIGSFTIKNKRQKIGDNFRTKILCVSSNSSDDFFKRCYINEKYEYDEDLKAAYDYAIKQHEIYNYNSYTYAYSYEYSQVFNGDYVDFVASKLNLNMTKIRNDNGFRHEFNDEDINDLLDVIVKHYDKISKNDINDLTAYLTKNLMLNKSKFDINLYKIKRNQNYNSSSELIQYLINTNKQIDLRLRKKFENELPKYSYVFSIVESPSITKNTKIKYDLASLLYSNKQYKFIYYDDIIIYYKNIDFNLSDFVKNKNVNVLLELKDKEDENTISSKLISYNLPLNNDKIELSKIDGLEPGKFIDFKISVNEKYVDLDSYTYSYSYNGYIYSYDYYIPKDKFINLNTLTIKNIKI